jgi:predicted dehydrogenase
MMNAGPPRSAVCHGYIADATGGVVPDVFTAVFEYPGFMATWTLNYTSSYGHDWSILFQGDKAAMIMDRLGYRIYKDAGPSPTPWNQAAKPELIGQEPDRDAPEAHPQNFLDCVRSRKEPNCTVEIAAAAVTGPHMANLALLRDKKIKLAPDGTAA